MFKKVFKTMAALLAIAAAAAGPAWGQNSTTYNVTFSGFSMGYINTTVSVTSLPQTFTSVDDYDFQPWNVFSEECFDFWGAPVTSGGEGKVSANFVGGKMSITVSGTFSGTATIHVTGVGEEGGLSTDVYVSCVAPAVPHTVRFAAGNDGWSVQDVTASASATAPAVLQNVMAGDSLVVTAPATLPGKVKSVKAVKYVPPAATVTTAPTATAGIIEAGSTAALVGAGAANGGTMMYAVTTTNAQPASTADFSAAIPTAQGRTAGTYYVWYYAKADAEHSDSEIAGPVSVTLAVMTTVTWNSTNVFNDSHQDDELSQWYPNPLTYEGITISFSGPDDSYFKAYTHIEQTGALTCFGEGGDSFTFTAPSGKKFCKIEIINDEWSIAFDQYGDWTQPEDNKVVWSGTAANAVTLGTVFTSATDLNSIVFKLIDAQ